ncbi:hypothetical protein [Streptomyces marispadix]|uniref:Lipoprotein n=1 Tax=Streptomyces marispadix TaxID=2922868 RepID=A0ABS9T0M2_9ACTN|nr:hypothetical protein [Streptomyces marispadix]MCH6161978.1 hypothetical protein [Streptomyces marispadix]
MRRSARRAGAVAVIAAGALLMSGCGSGDDGGKDEGGKGKPEASASKSASEGAGKTDKPSGDGETGGDATEGAPDDGRGGDSGKSGSGKYAGVWKAKGKQYVLTVVGDKVTLLRERGRNCTGSLGGSGGRTVALKCPGGADEARTNGEIGALKGKSMTVSWKGGPTEVYARVTDVPVELPEE